MKRQKIICWFTSSTTDFDSVSICLGMEYDYSLKIKVMVQNVRKDRKFEKELFQMVERIKIHARQLRCNNQTGKGYQSVNQLLKNDFFELIEK